MGQFRSTPATVPARQVEVLRECLLRLFEDDPTLDPRDVLVMCPDVETYAPLVRGAFGQVFTDTRVTTFACAWRIGLCVRPIRCWLCCGSLLELADGRVTASEVLDLAATAPVRTRFGSRATTNWNVCGEWTDGSGCAVGHRRQAASHVRSGAVSGRTPSTPPWTESCWASARTNPKTRWLDLALPLDDVDSTDIDLSWTFRRVHRSAWQSRFAILRGPHSPAEWLRVLMQRPGSAHRRAPADAWQSAGGPARTCQLPSNSVGDDGVRLADVRAMLSQQPGGRRPGPISAPAN